MSRGHLRVVRKVFKVTVDRNAYMLTIEEVGNVSTFSRKLLDTEAWNFVQNGGAVPDKVREDTCLLYGTYAEVDDALDGEEDYRMRASRIGGSTFRGEVCPSDMNAIVQFVVKHGLTIVDEDYVDDAEP